MMKRTAFGTVVVLLGLLTGGGSAETVLIDMAADASTWNSRFDWNRGAFHRTDSRYQNTNVKQMTGYMKFDIDMEWLQGLGSGQINSATFKGNGWALIEGYSNNEGHVLRFWRITESDWVEGTETAAVPPVDGGVTWRSPANGAEVWNTPGHPEGVMVASTDTWGEDPLDIDITDAVKAWADGEPNYGITHDQDGLVLEGGSAYSSFWSREAEADQDTYPGAKAPQLEIVYGEAQQIPGDANNDGSVNDDDLSLLLASWGQDTDWAHGEFNGVPPVDDDDLSLLLANWTTAAAVPEPGTILVTVVGGLLLKRRRMAA